MARGSTSITASGPAGTDACMATRSETSRDPLLPGADDGQSPQPALSAERSVLSTFPRAPRHPGPLFGKEAGMGADAILRAPFEQDGRPLKPVFPENVARN